MGAWEQGIIMANAMDRNSENNTIERLNARVRKAEPLLGAYQRWMRANDERKKPSASMNIFGELRPDLAKKDPKYNDRYYKRVFNLKLIAWSEWWGQMLAGQREMNKQDSPKLRGLSQLIEKGAATTPAAAKALADIADRLEMVADMENGRDWVERAVAHYSKTVKYTGDATKPNVGTVAYLTPVFLRDKEGLKYDGFKDNLYGINDMSM